MKKLCIPLLTGFFSVTMGLFAQEPHQKVLEWVAQIGGSGDQVTTGVVCNDQGKIFVAGQFNGSLLNTKIPVESNGYYDLFAAMYNADGSQEWIWSAGGEGIESLYCMAVDKNNDILIAGEASPGIEFGSVQYNVPKNFLFLARLNQNGESELITEIQFSNIATISKIEITPGGSIILGGIFIGSLTTQEQSLESDGGNKDIYVAYLDENGSLINWYTVGGPGTEILSGLACENDSTIYLSGLHDYQFEWQSETVYVFEHDVYRNSFIAKLQHDTLQWVKSMRGSKYLNISDLEATDRGELYFCGDFEGELQFDTLRRYSTAIVDIYLAKTDAEGNVNWLKQYGSKYMDYSNSLVITQEKNILLTGNSNDSIRFGNINLIPETNALNTFVVLFDPEGEALWGDHLDGDKNVLGRASAIDNKGNLYTTGTFRTTLIVSDEEILSSYDKKDAFLAKFFNCELTDETIHSLKNTVCSGEQLDLWIEGKAENVLWNDTTYDVHQITIQDPGTYTVQYSNNMGCHVYDTITISQVNLPIFDLGNDTSLSVYDQLVLHAPEEYSDLLWQDQTTDSTCLVESLHSIPGEEFYWLQVTDSAGCTYRDTILIEFYVPSRIIETDLLEELFYPNPVHEKLYWNIRLALQNELVVKLIDSTGKPVYQEYISSCPGDVMHSIDMQPYKPGMYIFIVQYGQNIFSKKILHY